MMSIGEMESVSRPSPCLKSLLVCVYVCVCVISSTISLFDANISQKRRKQKQVGAVCLLFVCFRNDIISLLFCELVSSYLLSISI